MGKLEYYRKKIDIIDKNIVKLLLSRFRLVKRIAYYKKINGLKIIDEKRESKVLQNIKKYSKSNQNIIKIFKNIINFSKKLQK